MQRSKPVWWYGCACGCLGVVLWMLTTALAQPGRPGGPPPVPVVVDRVIQQPLAPEIDVVGTVEPRLMTTLSAEIAGLTARFDLREGDTVQQHKTVVAQLKETDLQLALVEAEAELAKAKEGLRKLKGGLRPEEIDEKRAQVQEHKAWTVKYARDLERAKSMQSKDLMSMAEYDLAQSNYTAAQAQLERVQKTLRVAELGFRQEDIAVAVAEVERLQARSQRLRDDLQKTSIRSPVSGVIIQRYTEVGQWIERGGKVADIAVLDSVLVRVPIPERDITHVRVGDEVVVRLDALPDRTFAGRVKHIIPQADPASRTFPVKIEVANTPDMILKAGMFARVTLPLGAAQARLFVPKDAVVRQDDNQLVFVVQDNTARQVLIKTGHPYNGFIEVLDGALTAGDTVVVTGNENLRDQSKVIPRQTPPN